MRSLKVLAVVGLAVAFLISWSGYSIENLKCEIRDLTILGQKIAVLVFEGDSLANADVEVVVDPDVMQIKFEGKTDAKGHFKIEITQGGVVNYAGLPANVTVTDKDNKQDVGQCTIKDVRQAVPTLTEWGLIALAVLLAGSLAFMIRRRLAPRPAGA